MRRILALALATVPALVVATSCLSPTQITVRVRTDFECEPSMTTDVRAGDAATGSKTGCERPREVGDVVLVPSAKPGRFTVRVNASTSFGAIEALRSITYVPHASLELPITLYAACANRTCEPGETCVAQGGEAKCVSASVEPSACAPPRVCDETVLDASAPKPPLPLDAGTDVRADVVPIPKLDAGKLCLSSSVPLGLNLLERWTFDNETIIGSIKTYGANSTLLQCATFNPAATKECGKVLDLRTCPADSPQILEADMPHPANFAVAIRFLVAQAGLVAEHLGAGGWRLVAMPDYSLQADFLGEMDGMAPNVTVSGAWMPNAWVEASIVCGLQNCALNVGKANLTVSRPAGRAMAGALRLGAGCAFDELAYFQLK